MNDAPTPAKPLATPRVFSGVQPTGNLHLGNYLGAITRFVALQASHECLYCVVDLHAITVPQDPEDLRSSIRDVTAAFLAAGIDAERHIVFNQSRVPEHAELAWVLNCVARLGWLNRMTQFKEKAGKDRENASIGLYAYPVLMAADILVYRATQVPVGEDQKQHLELARDIAQKFNTDYAAAIAAQGHGEAFFPLPEPLIQGAATRVMSLRDGTKKMSKSDPSDNSRINLTDDADMIAQKIRRAKTDPDALPSEVAGTGRTARGGQSRGHLRGAGRATQGGGAAPVWRRPVLHLQGRARGPGGRPARSARDCHEGAAGRSRPHRQGSGARRRTGRRHRPSHHGCGEGDRRAAALRAGAVAPGTIAAWTGLHPPGHYGTKPPTVPDAPAFRPRRPDLLR